MKIIFHEKYYDSTYAGDPAAAPGRLDGIMRTVENDSDIYEVIVPAPAEKEDILRAHTERHYNNVKE